MARDNPSPNYVPVIEHETKGHGALTVKVSVKDTELFEDIVVMLKSILDNTDIDKVIRDYYHDMLQNIMDNNNN